MSLEAVDNDLLQAAVERKAVANLAQVREDALARFRATGLPDTRHEEWRYTNLAPIAELSNQWLAARQQDVDAASPALSPAQSAPRAGVDEIDAEWIEIRNGALDPASLAGLSRKLGTGVTVGRLSDLSDTKVLHLDDALSSLNAALMDDALCIEVGPNVTLGKPIGLLLVDDAVTAGSLSQTRLLIRVGVGAAVEFVELHRSTGDLEHFANLVTEIDLDHGALARYVKIQERREHHMQTGRLLVELGRDSTFEHASVDLGGKLVRNDVVATIAGAGAHLSTSGIYLAHGSQHIDNHISVDHTVGPATSRLVYRGIASGRARCVFNGKALVRKGADGTDAEQSNHNLLLSDRAEIDTKPELEIYADDVKCSHGATVGQLDKTALFYLRSRGLDRDQAAQVLTRAFAGSIIGDMPIAAVRPYIETIVDRKLDALVEDEPS